MSTATLLRATSPAPGAHRHPVAPSLAATRAPGALGLQPVLVFGLGGLVFSVLSLAIYARFGTSMDLTIFAQAIRNLAHGHAPEVPLKGPHANILGDHWHPLVLALAPLFWLWDDPRVLLVAQAFAVSAAGAILTRECVRRGAAPGLLGAALLVSPGVVAAIVFDVHEVALGAPLLAMACARFVNRRWVAAAGWSLALLPVKEDAGLLVVGLALALWARGQRRLAMLLAAVAVTWMALAVRVFIPSMNASGHYTYAGMAPMGPSTLVHTLSTSLLWPGLALWTAVLLVAATAGAALRSPLVVVAAVSWLVRAAMPNWRYWAPVYHYSLLPAIALFFAALDSGALGRSSVHRRWVARIAVVSALAAVPVVVLHLVGTDPDAAQAALARVPAGAPVAVPANLSAHLVTRNPVTLLLPGADPLDPTRPSSAARWLVVDDSVPGSVDPRGLSGWTVVWTSGRYTVVRR